VTQILYDQQTNLTAAVKYHSQNILWIKRWK